MPPRFPTLIGLLGMLPLTALTLLAIPSTVLAPVLLVAVPAVHAQNAEAIAKAAQRITVRIEGATQGSGVLVKRDGNRYEVLTAWHVVSDQQPGEELAIHTPDGRQYQVERGSVQHLGNVDLGVLRFLSGASYEVAQIGDVQSVKMGGNIYVAGFPVATSAVPARLLRFLDGRVIANAQVAIPNGYQLLYSNPTQSGMSGGPVLNGQGQLVGIHGQAETDFQLSEQSGVAVKTGTSQGVPIAFYISSSSSRNAGSRELGKAVPPTTDARTADDNLALAKQILEQKGKEQEVIQLSTQALALQDSAEAYFYRAYARQEIGDHQGAIMDYSQLLMINPKSAATYVNRGRAKKVLGDNQGAISDLSQGLMINPKLAEGYVIRGQAKHALGDNQGATSDLSQALMINPKFAVAYEIRGQVKYSLGDNQGAITDLSKALKINPMSPEAFAIRGQVKYALGDNQGAILDLSKALLINPKFAEAYAIRGSLKGRLGDNKGAIEDCNKALIINPEFADVYATRGGLKARLGDNQGAIEDYNQALMINPKFVLVYAARGLSQMNLGLLQSACNDWTLAASMGDLNARKLAESQCR